MIEAEFLGGPMDGKIANLDDLIGDDIDSVDVLLEYTVNIDNDIYKFVRDKKEPKIIRLVYSGRRE